MKSDVGNRFFSDAAPRSAEQTIQGNQCHETDIHGGARDLCTSSAASDRVLQVSVDGKQTCAIGVMAKAPQPGRSKTRLCPPLDWAQAAMLSAAFLRDTTSNLQEAASQAAPDLLIVPYAAFAPAGSEALVASAMASEMRLVLADGTPAMPVGVEGFGRCLLHAVQAMLSEGHASACVLSSDTPNLPTELLVTAARRLAEPGDRAVLGACDDGGYYLLGLKAAHAALFSDIAWSTDSVAATTRARAAEIGLELVELPSWYDVDDAASLGTLLRDTRGYPAPRTHATIESLGLRTLLQKPFETTAAIAAR